MLKERGKNWFHIDFDETTWRKLDFVKGHNPIKICGK